MRDLNVVTEILDLAEARRRLPAVREAVEPLMRVTAELRDANNRLSRIDIEQGQEEADAARTAVATLEAQWRDAFLEVNRLGACVKDPAIGLVDFYTWVNDELALLCWHWGEPDIGYWHGLDDGFAGRRPIEE